MPAAARGSWSEDEALHITVVAPFLQQPVKGVEAGPIGLAQMRAEHLFALVVVIAGRALPVPVGDRCLPDDPDPFVLGLLAGFHGYGSASQCFLDDIGDVAALLLKHRGRVRGHAGLGEAGKELIGETAPYHAVKRPFRRCSPMAAGQGVL
jgi:hypothetical protein